VFLRYEPSKIGLVSSSFRQGMKVVVKHYPIALKFGTLKGRIRAHPGTILGCNTTNYQKVINIICKK